MTANDQTDAEKLRDQIECICLDDRWLKGIVMASVALTLLIPFLPVAKQTIYFSLFNLMLFSAAIGIAGFRNFNTAWVRLFTDYRKGQLESSALLAAVQSFAADRLAMSILGISVVAFLTSCAESFLYGMYRYGGLSSVVASAFLAATLFPVSSVLGLLIARKIRILPSIPTNLPAKIQRKLNLSTRSFLIKRYPYLASYAGFGAFCAIATLAPDGVGAAVAGWLHHCAVAANISRLEPIDPMFQLSVSLIVALFLFGAVQGLAVRLSAGFQSIAERLLLHRDNLLEAIMETANVRSTRINLPERHPHLKNISSCFGWFIFCYAALFYLVAFCPPPLGAVIANWLNACLRDANFAVNLQQHENLRLFLASVIAAYGSVPLAVTATVFLPSKKPDCLIVSAKGVISPQTSNPAQAPLKQWEDLKSVSLTNVGKQNETLKLSFKSYGTIKLKTAKLEKQKIAELLATADEYAPKCKFDASAIIMRSKLTEETRAGSLADHSKFASTIFSTKTGGDSLHDGQYRIVRKLAGKPLTAVYLARDLAENHVIIKEFVLPTCVKQTEEMDQSFDREFKALSMLKHQSIANVIETFEKNQAKYIVIEHINGSDLRSIVQKRGRREEKTVLRWAKEIAVLMQYLHSQETPILHRDLTPDNLMEDTDGNVKLIDFGAAHQFIEGVTGTLIGKQCYIAPEQLRGKPSVQSDIYSFGCTMYFLLTGRDPNALEQCDLEAAQVGTSPWLNQMLKNCTAFDADLRYQTFDEIIVALSQTSARQLQLRSTDPTIPIMPTTMELEKVD